MPLWILRLGVFPRRDTSSTGYARPLLRAGEMMVLELLDAQFSPDWGIYIQPHMNGLKPGFLLLSPRAGIAVFEVKDWNLDAMTYRVVERKGKSPLLRATKAGADRELFLKMVTAR